VLGQRYNLDISTSVEENAFHTKYDLIN